MFENKDFEGIYYSRFIASYINIRGKLDPYDFRDWLRSITINGKKIPEDVINDMYILGSNGKLELEDSCRKFFKNK